MRIITAADVHAHLTPATLIDQMRLGLREGGVVPRRTHHDIGGQPGHATLLLMPAWREQGAMGIKIASVHRDNAAAGLPTVMATYVLLCARTGAARALIDGVALTVVRTAAVSAVAADLLAPPAARKLAMIGTGALAPHLVRAHCAIRAIDDVRVFGRDPVKAGALVAMLRAERINAVATADIEDAVDGADVVSCATTSLEPLFRAAMLAPSAHIDLVGGFRPEMREADDDVFADALVVTDSDTACDECGDLIGPIERGVLDRQSVVLLGDLLRDVGVPKRRAAGRSVFKSVGTALADLIAADALMADLEQSPQGALGARLKSMA